MKKPKSESQEIQLGQWQCVTKCGACCNLTPKDRPDLDKYLSTEELEQYMTMVGPDGWCLNYDHAQRNCRIYDDRPRFCRVQPDNFESMYGVAQSEFNEFAIACCQEQICGVYGESSEELERYIQAVSLN